MKLEVVRKGAIEERVNGKKRVVYTVDVKYNNKVLRVTVDKSRYFRTETGKLVNVTHNEINEGETQDEAI